jgi:hypothetical protein
MRKKAPVAHWIVEQDENHPDPRVAAKHADANARSFALESFQRRLRRLKDKPTALTPEEAQMFMLLKDEIARVEADIAAAKEDE